MCTAIDVATKALLLSSDVMCCSQLLHSEVPAYACSHGSSQVCPTVCFLSISAFVFVLSPGPTDPPTPCLINCNVLGPIAVRSPPVASADARFHRDVYVGWKSKSI